MTDDDPGGPPQSSGMHGSRMAYGLAEASPMPFEAHLRFARKAIEDAGN